MEFDVLADSSRRALCAARGFARGWSGPALRARGARRTGLKVLHIQDIDFETQLPALRQLPRDAASWSRAHPFHDNADGDGGMQARCIADPLRARLRRPARVGAHELDGLDAEIRSWLPRTS
jgi:hypothetical protein